MKNTPLNEAIHSRYLIANEQDLLWGLTITTVGKQSVGRNERYPPVNHPIRYLFSCDKGRILNEYQLVYIVRGSGTFASASSKQTTIKAGNMFLLFPGEWHSYKPNKQTGWEEYWIGFKGENIDNRIRHGFFSKQTPVFYIGILEEVAQLYNQAIVVAREQKAGFHQLLAGIANHLLGLAYSLDKHHSFEDLQVANHINRAKIIFYERFQTGIRPEDVASELNMSYSWFRRLFKEYTGFPPSQYIQELRIQFAKELLTNTSLSIKEIAFKSGFEHPEYFSTAFKHRVGCTPLEYREFTQGKTI